MANSTQPIGGVARSNLIEDYQVSSEAMPNAQPPATFDMYHSYHGRSVTPATDDRLTLNASFIIAPNPNFRAHTPDLPSSRCSVQ